MTDELQPAGRSADRSPCRWRALVASAAALSLLASIGMVVVSAGIAGAVATCATTQAGKVTYATVATPAPSRPTALTVISSVTLSNLNAGCNGQTAELVFEGNTTGDPSGSKATLSTVTSARNPCTGTPLATPVKIATGSITVALCPTPGTAGSYVHVHDLTFLTLSIAGVTVPVTTSTGSSNNSDNGTQRVATATAASTGLAFTGADIAAMVGGGLLVILLGLFLLLVSRQRRGRQATDGMP